MIKSFFNKKSNGWMFGTILLFICFLIQFIGTIRYYYRMPNDLIGLTIYTVTIIFFAISSFGFYINYKKEKEKNLLKGDGKYDKN